MTLYRGRFAPSPTGPLHFGSLVAALGSCLEARSHGGQWLVRMEDLDPPRAQPGAAELILHTLEDFAFEWDGAVMRQSDRSETYAQAIAQLHARGALYDCACTRKELSDSALVLEGERVYPGTCRNGLPPGRRAHAVRVRVPNHAIAFADTIRGSISQILEREVGDFVVRRADGLHAYQLAVVVDDAAQSITDVVRGADLLASTPRQIHLQRLLELPTPRYAHLPAAVNALGAKLSKQTLARPLDPARAAATIAAALAFLGQAPPPELARAALREVWDWSLAHWNLDRVPRQHALPAPADA
ncbi:MAG: tRNA glutamyl-Q(34) synthetase GluQRS [Betaproteobacteria bacterium RBG_16_64_18]|nr:MAG: tRNA glutamyl-Q(34) synthetase GluQRS [Betaproteobacteria bacterium RBG_16_64_18]OGA38216.1 MAG: tRNA glutamyl-Q(34) synthetase GluQRS [Betaproteobacteria bacterium RIFCSPLOWO2_12_FULL_65_110]